MLDNVTYTLSNFAMQKAKENGLEVIFENDNDDGRSFFTALVKNRHGDEISRNCGSDYGRVCSELDKYLTQYEGRINFNLPTCADVYPRPAFYLGTLEWLKYLLEATVSEGLKSWRAHTFFWTSSSSCFQILKCLFQGSSQCFKINLDSNVYSYANIKLCE